jgi:hypothetical protein
MPLAATQFSSAITEFTGLFPIRLLAAAATLKGLATAEYSGPANIA